MDWHIQVGGAQEGPLSEPELMVRVADGRLLPEHAVWSAGMPQWVPAAQVQPFAAAFAGVPYTAPVPAQMGDDALLRAILPVGRSGWAIASGYLGLFSVLLIPAPFAVATGIAAIVSIKRNPSKHGMGRAIFGIAMGALGTLALCALLLSSMG